jgi:hypothetical protein
VVIYPTVGTVHVYDSASSARILSAADTLDVGAALPGFSVAVADLFAPLNPPANP